MQPKRVHDTVLDAEEARTVAKVYYGAVFEAKKEILGTN